MDKFQMSGVAISLAVVALMAIYTVFPQVRYIIDKLLSPFAFIGKILAKATGFIIPKFVTEFLEKQLSGRVFKFFLSRWESSPFALIAGQREVYAARRWRKDEFPELWWTNIPKDLQHDVVIDGYLPDGTSIGQLGSRFIDKQLVKDCYNKAIETAVKRLPFIFMFWLAVLSVPVGGVIGYDRPSFSMTATEAVLKMDKDVWSQKDVDDYISSQETIHKIKSGAGKVVVTAGLSAGAVLVAGIISILITVVTLLGAWRGNVNSAAKSQADVLGFETKELVRWKYRVVERDFKRRVWLNQIKIATTFDKSPLVKVGTATGFMSAHGVLYAPERGSDIWMSLDDMGQGGLMFSGGTGEGKSLSGLLPLVDQFFAFIIQGYKLSLFGMDGKGVIFHDIIEKAKKFGLKYFIIGCLPGEYGVDLVGNREPRIVAEDIDSSMRQAGGKGDSDYWTDSARDMIRISGVVARAWELTDGGYAKVLESNERVYSLLSIGRLCEYDDSLIEAIKDINYTIVNNRGRFSGIDMHELNDAIKYSLDGWIPMVKETKDGIRGNIKRALSPFQSGPLRNAFATGGAENITTIEECWGRITAVNVSSLTYGVAGRIVNIMLKTSLYAESKRRELIDPAIGKREKMVFLADEFQGIATVDAAGMSDRNFWNESRSAGMIAVVATQSITSLEQAIGDVNAKNFVLQMRNKIFLRVEDKDTIDLIKYLAGQTLRAYVHERGQYESYEVMKWEIGDPLKWAASTVEDAKDPESFVMTALAPLSFLSDAKYHAADLRFIPSPTTGFGMNMQNNSMAVLSAQQASQWRAEEKNVELMKSGYQSTDVVSTEDVMQMGRIHAFVSIQRAGAGVQDFCELRAIG